MAEKLVSAGVFTQENDLSYLPQGVAAIGAAIVGPTPKGPAFIPTLIETQTDYTTIFGNPDGKTYVPYTVQNYLQNAGRVTVVRVANLEGYNSDALAIDLSGTATNQNIIFTIASGSGGVLAPNVTVSQVAANSTLFTLKHGGSVTFITASIDPDSTLWLPTVLGNSFATSVTGGFFVSQSYSSYASSILDAITTGSSVISATLIITGSNILSATGSSTLSSTEKTLCILAPTSVMTTVTGSWGVWGASGLNFNISASGVASSTYALSFNPSSNNYIENVFGKDPNGSKHLYVYANFPTREQEIATAIIGATSASTSISSTVLNGKTSTSGIQLTSSVLNAYVESVTPWIQSQTINNAKINLFRFHTFNSGKSDIKISISDIKMPSEMPSGISYGTFTVLVRDINDIDTRPVVLETYSGCTLDPASANYILRKIGNQYRVSATDADGITKLSVFGDFANKSKRIYVQINSTDSIPSNAMPFGNDSYKRPVIGVTTFPVIDYNTTQYSNNEFNYRTYLGFDFTNDDNMHVLNPVVNSATSFSGIFNLENCFMANAAGTSPVAFETTSSDGISTFGKRARKFSVAFQGGFDGFNPTIEKSFAENITTSTNIMGFDLTSGTTGVTAFKKGIDMLANPDEIDINMLIIPGVTNDLASSVINYANNMCEERADVFFLFDSIIAASSVNDAVISVQEIDSNYAATYYPWVKIYDQTNTKYIWAPPSVVLAGVISFNDRVSAPWWAPAGLNRGGLDSVTQVYNRITQAERDALYEGRINPIVAFAGLGFAAWGQKTLQLKSSALDRINVRRLLIELKKYIASASKYLVFEQNTVATRTRFLNIVNPYLASVQQKSGLYAFKVVMDETNNTPDVIDRNILKGEIYIQPAKTAEYIVIDFNVLPTGATFSQ